MLKALLRKQFQSMGYSLFRRSAFGKKGKGGKGSLLLYGLLIIYLVGVFGFLSFTVMNSLCPTLLSLGLDWLYFAYGCIMATALAVVGSIFATQTQLYEARDNELLLALPIEPRAILFCRMAPLYVQNFAFEALVLLPCFIVYGRTAPAVSAVAVLAQALLLVLLPLFSLTLCCALGAIIASISSKVRNKNAVTVALSLAFLVAYFYCYSQINRYLQLLLTNAEVLSDKVKLYFRFFYDSGRAAAGNLSPLLLCVGVMLALFALCYWLLSRSYIRIVTNHRGAKKTVYREKALRSSSADAALLRREARHFFGSPIYLLNCGLGSLFLLAGTVALLWKGPGFLAAGMIPAELRELLSPLIVVTICSMGVLNCVSAPSVSLEGKSLWISQSLPVSTAQVLHAKLRLHCLVSAPFAALCGLAAGIVLGESAPVVLLMALLPVAYVMFIGYLGLFFNLLKPNLFWDSETVAVKQSLAVILTIFGGWGVLLLLGGLWALLCGRLGVRSAFVICLVLLAVVCRLLDRWVCTKGAARYEAL